MTEVQAVLLTGAAAVLVAIWGIFSQRSITRRKTTLELIARNEADHDLISGYRKFLELARNDGGLAAWADVSKEKSEETQTIRLILNQYELISIGIQRGVLDGVMWMRWHRSATLKTWQYAAPFVMALRARLANDAFYHEFEELAKALQENKMPKRNLWLGRFF